MHVCQAPDWNNVVLGFFFVSQLLKFDRRLLIDRLVTQLYCSRGFTVSFLLKTMKWGRYSVCDRLPFSCIVAVFLACKILAHSFLAFAKIDKFSSSHVTLFDTKRKQSHLRFFFLGN